MLDPKLDEVRALKKKATALRNRGRLEAAKTALDESIEALESTLAAQDLPESEAREVRAELADTFGMKGGVLRRQGDLLAALASYEQGLAVEEVDRQSTYNLSNVIALSITQKGQSPRDPELHRHLEPAIAHLKAETAGPRRDEWWAWSDLAQFYLLNDELGKARACYANARERTGVTAEEINRHVAILRELSEKTAETAPDISKNLQIAIQELEG
jgi:tetratricopeptide (TPR) repeat protein